MPRPGRTAFLSCRRSSNKTPSRRGNVNVAAPQMNSPTLNQLTISELAARLGRREVSAREATEACLKQIETVDGRIRAFLSYDRTDALAQADRADQQFRDGQQNGRPLLGVPVAIKDVIAVKDQPLNCASRILKNFIS